MYAFIVIYIEWKWHLISVAKSFAAVEPWPGNGSNEIHAGLSDFVFIDKWVIGGDIDGQAVGAQLRSIQGHVAAGTARDSRPVG